MKAVETSKNMSLVKASDTKRRNFMRTIIIFQVVYLLVFNGLFASISVLSKAKYLLDIATLTLCVGLFEDRRDLYKIKGKAYYIPLLIYSIVCVGTAIAYKTPPLIFLWAIRNTFRFFVFFFGCIVYIQKDDIKRFCDFLIKLQFVNVPIILIQHFYFKQFTREEIRFPSDHISGIFGFNTGSNGLINIYICLVLIIILVDFFEREKIKWIHIFTLGNVMFCMAFAELKVFLPEAIVIFAICCLLYCKKIAKRPLLFASITLLFIFLMVVGVILMIELYPGTQKNFQKSYSEYEAATSSVYKLGRIGAFSKINDIFFKNDILKNLFGLGFGNCEYSNFSFLVSDFYQKYGDYNYRWFTHQMLYLETGAVGFVSFASFFISTAIQALVFFHKQPRNRKIAVFSIALSAVLFSNLWYNCIIRADFGYVCYFCLAFMPIFVNNKNYER